MRMIDADILKNRFERAQAEALKENRFDLFGALVAFIRVVDEQPTIEAEPVLHGRWMFHEQKNGYLWKCSNCKGNFDQQFSYCPHCGAEMGGGADNEN